MRSLVIHYRRHDGRLAAEFFELGADGTVVRSIAHDGDAAASARTDGESARWTYRRGFPQEFGAWGETLPE